MTGVRRVEVRGTRGGWGERLPGSRGSSGALGARRGVRSARGRAARGGTERPEPGLSGTGAPESGAHQGAPAEPEGRRRRAAPRPGSRQPPGRLRRAESVRLHGKAVRFCLLAPRLRRSLFFPLPEIFAVV